MTDKLDLIYDIVKKTETKLDKYEERLRSTETEISKHKGAMSVLKFVWLPISGVLTYIAVRFFTG